MDDVMMHWQELTSLGIVAVTIFLMTKKFLARRKVNQGCEHCALVQPQQAPKKSSIKHP